MRVLPRGIAWHSLTLTLLAAFGARAAAEDAGGGTKLDALALAQRIDQAVQQRLDAEKVQPSGPMCQSTRVIGMIASRRFRAR